jgi:PAS domain S-box-containing protein
MDAKKHTISGETQTAPGGPESRSPEARGTGQELAPGAEQITFLIEDRLQLLEEGLNEYAVILFDAQARVATWNRGAERVFGYREDEIVGQPASRLFPPEDVRNGRYDREMRTAATQGRASDVGWQLRQDGSRFWANGSTTAFKDQAGNLRGFIKVVRDMTDVRAAEETLRESEHRLRLALDAARMGIWRWNIQTNRDMLDENLYRLLGRTPDGTVNTLEDFLGLLHPQDRAAAAQAFSRSAREGVELNIEFRVVWPDGSVHWLRDQGGLFRDPQGQPLYLTGVCVDVTRLKELEAAAQRRAEEMAEEDRRKDEFLAMLSHELRNPLAPIQSAVQVLRLSGQTESSRQWAQDVLDRQVQHLTRLVDDLLDVSRITRGKVQLHRESVDLATVLARAVEAGRPLIEARRHQLNISLPNGRVLLDADPVRLTQVVANLLHNAAKYTEAGGQIWLTAATDAGEAVIRVRDSGIGIAPEMLPRVFDLFAQAERSLDRSQGGLGIGLTLVRRLVDLHGGTVEAHSAGLNQGSEFIVRLPLGSSPGRHDGESPQTDRVPGAPTQPRRVLVVDDNVDAAESLAMVLRMMGHQARTAHNGQAALAAAQEFQPQVALLDIGLPGMDGYEIARRFRRQPGLGQALLVALTGYGQEDDRRRSREAGFDHHLVKPVDLDALQQLLAGAAAGHQ